MQDNLISDSAAVLGNYSMFFSPAVQHPVEIVFFHPPASMLI